MNEKTQRYMQRIQKIMLTPRKTNTQSRPSKSPINCKPHHLDKYLKYQLSTTIIQNIINNFNQHLLTQFFNNIRTSQYRQRQRIYKFIPIQKNQKPVRYDLALSIKILSNALKAIMRRKYGQSISSLEKFAKQIPQKNKIQRKKSTRNPQSYAVLMRTSTKPQLENYKIINQWIDGSSNGGSKKDKLTEKVRLLSVQNIVKIISTKIKMNNLCAFYKIKQFVSRYKTNGSNKNKNHQSQKQNIQEIQKKPKTQYTFKNQQEKIYLSARSIGIFSNIVNKHLFQIMNRIKTKAEIRQMQIQYKFIHLYEAIDKITLGFKLRNSRFFLYQINNKLKLTLSRIKQKMEAKNEIIFDSPLLKLQNAGINKLKESFDCFVNKIQKLVLVVDKKMFPLKDAFAKIDQFASFSYRLEQSLKGIPKSTLLYSFNQIKHFNPNKMNAAVKDDLQSKTNQFCQHLMPIILQRLIEGFIFIKIVERKRSLTLNLTPVKDTIIQDTMKFIRDREQHSSLSYENWNQLKSILLSPKSSQSRSANKILI